MIGKKMIYAALTLSSAIALFANSTLAATATLEIVDGKTANDLGVNSIRVGYGDTLAKTGAGTLAINNSQGAEQIEKPAAIEGMIDLQAGIVSVGHKDALGNGKKTTLIGDQLVDSDNNVLRMADATRLEFAAELGAPLSVPIQVANQQGSAAISFDFRQNDNSLPGIVPLGSHAITMHFMNSPANSVSNMKDLALSKAFIPGNVADRMMADKDINLVVDADIEMSLTEKQYSNRRQVVYAPDGGLNGGFKLNAGNFGFGTPQTLSGNEYTIYKAGSGDAMVYHLYTGMTEGQWFQNNFTTVYVEVDSSVGGGFKTSADSQYSVQVSLVSDSALLVMKAAGQDVYYTMSSGGVSVANIPMSRLAPVVDLADGSQLTVLGDVVLPQINCVMLNVV